MALVSMPVDLASERQLQHSTSTVSNTEGFTRDLIEIEEELALATPRKSSSSVFSRSNSMRINDDSEENLYIAVGKEYRDSKSTLIWALRKSRRTKNFVLLHIHCPSHMIHIMGGCFHVSQLTTEQIETHRAQEKEKMNKILDEYMFICEIAKVRADKLVIEADDVTKGLLQAIIEHGITRLVMGAAADKYYTKRLRAPVSTKACIMMKEALPTCNIWFVSKGNLICTREDNLDASAISSSPLASPRARAAQSRLRRSRSASQSICLSEQDEFDHMSRSCSTELLAENASQLPEVGHDGKNGSTNLSDVKESPVDIEKEVSRGSEVSNPSLTLGVDGADGSDKKPEKEVNMNEQVQGGFSAEDDWNIHIQQVVSQAANLLSGAYKESQRRCRAEREAYEANHTARLLELNYAKELKLREEVEQSLVQEKLEVQKLKTRLDDILQELEKANNSNSFLKEKIAGSDAVVKDLEDKLLSAKALLNSLQTERHNAFRETEELRQAKEVTNSSKHVSTNFLEFSYLELEQATCNFDSSLKIGEGGFGCVYKGYIRHTKVAIKVLNHDSIPGESDFHQEIDNLSRLRHPNLVTLIGACPETLTLVYEFLPNGSLEDRLSCRDGTSPLSWQVRVRISAEICSALIFLHSNKPSAVVHGDLRPANILLDANFVSKLCDFNISRLLIQSTTSLYNWTDPKGTFVYMDPEFFSTGELTPHSDIYSFGIIILRLLTGKPALGIVKEVQEALEKGKLPKILDLAAGDWPYKQAQQLALLGLKCCEMKRKNRPDLVREVLKILEHMKAMTLL